MNIEREFKYPKTTRRCSELAENIAQEVAAQTKDFINDVHFPQEGTCQYLQQFHKTLNSLFYRLGHQIATHPSYFIIIPIFITIVGLTGVQHGTYETDPEYLFSPTNGKGQEERRIVEALFPVNYSAHFSPSRLTRMSHFGVFFVSAKDHGNIFRVNLFDEMLLLDEAIRNLTIVWQNETYTYTDVCAKWNGECLGNQVLELSDYMSEIEDGSLLLNYPISVFPTVLPFYLGGATTNESEGVLYGAKAISVAYWFRDDDWKQKERSHLFEGRILEFLKDKEFKHIHVARFVSRSLTDELDNNAQAITSYVFLTVGLMIAFSVLIVYTSDWVRSKLLVGASGVLAAALATTAAFGFLMYCEVPFIGINMAVPFLMLGIGIDDMFVILSAWHRTKIQEEVPIRLAKTYSEAAVSITITSLTNMLSFFIGTLTPFPAVRIFCLYTGFAILLTYIWFITFFGGCLAVAGRQERKQKHNVTCRKVLSKSEAENRGYSYKFWCTGGISENDPWNQIDNKEHSGMIFFRDYLGKSLNIPEVKAIVIFCFALYIGGAIYGCTTVKEGLERRKLTLDSSYLVDFFDTEDKWFRKYPSYRIQVIINEPLNYSTPEIKEKVFQLHDKFETLNCTGARIFSQSWIRGFYHYLERRPELIANITNEKEFINVLKSQYFASSSTDYLDVKFNEYETQIIGSRFIVQAFDIKDTNADKDMMLELRKVASEAPFSVEVYHPFFVFFDQYILVKYTCMQTVALAAIVMMVVSLIFIPNPLCSLWVAFSIISIEIGIIGYMSLWGVNLDSISMINLIMCVGFSVDFSAHISYAYLTAHATTPAGRVEECLYNLGLPVLQGGLSTIVGVLALVVAPSYIFTTFFKIVFLVIFFGLLHGILLLPVMLSLLGPGSRSRKDSIRPIVDLYENKANINKEKQTVVPDGDEKSIDNHEDSIDLGLGSLESLRNRVDDLNDSSEMTTRKDFSSKEIAYKKSLENGKSNEDVTLDCEGFYTIKL